MPFNQSPGLVTSAMSGSVPLTAEGRSLDHSSAGGGVDVVDVLGTHPTSFGDDGWNVATGASLPPADGDRASTSHRVTAPHVLVTIPVRNESARLVPTIRALKEAFDASGFVYKIAVAEDGSTDGTKAVLRDLPRLFPEIVIQEVPHAMGRGKALRQLWSGQIADIYCFTDADLASGPKDLESVVREVALGSDVVTGSRYSLGSRVRRPPLRYYVSLAYNWMVRTTFSDGVRDHQCGLKAFNAAAVERLMGETQEDSWFWDTEVLVLAHARGLRVKEVPVHWVERKNTRTGVLRLLKDVLLHGAGFIRLKSRVQARKRAPVPSPTSRALTRSE